MKKLDSREQTKLALEEKLLSRISPKKETIVDQEDPTQDENRDSFVLNSSVVEYEEGCCETSVPILALQYSPHNKSTSVPLIIVSLNCCIPGTGTIYAACLTES